MKIKSAKYLFMLTPDKGIPHEDGGDGSKWALFRYLSWKYPGGLGTRMWEWMPNTDRGHEYAKSCKYTYLNPTCYQIRP